MYTRMNHTGIIYGYFRRAKSETCVIFERFPLIEVAQQSVLFICETFEVALRLKCALEYHEKFHLQKSITCTVPVPYPH